MDARASLAALLGALTVAGVAAPLISARDATARHRIALLSGEVAALRVDVDHLTACEATRIPIGYDAAGRLELSATMATDRATVPIALEDCATRIVRPYFTRP
jgi:hypothetical protein